MINVVIPTIKERRTSLLRLLDSIPVREYDVTIVDNNDLSLSEKRNKGAKESDYPFILFIDDDNYLSVGAIEKALKVFENLSVGVVGMVACYSNDYSTIADGGSMRNLLTGFTKGLYTNQPIFNLWYKNPYEVDEVANAFIIKRELFEALDGFDSKTFPTELDEADFCRRVKENGFKIMMCPKAIVYHDSQTYSRIPDFRREKNAYYMGRNKVLFQKKHLRLIPYLLYLVTFLPLVVLIYTIALLYCRNKPRMLFYFLKGVINGIKGYTKNIY